MKNENIELFRNVLKIRGYSVSSISNYVSSLSKYIGIKKFDFSENSLLAYFYELRLKKYSYSTVRVFLLLSTTFCN